MILMFDEILQIPPFSLDKRENEKAITEQLLSSKIGKLDRGL